MYHLLVSFLNILYLALYFELCFNFLVKKRKLNKENSDNVVNVTTVEKNDENSQTFLSLFNDYGSNSDEDS